MTGFDAVASLLTETGTAPGSGSVVDWASVEGSLGGRTLPSDYKRLIENFPLGRFKESITVIRPQAPDEYLGYFARRLDDYREWRADGHGTFPYPLFPEPGGLLPWGFTAVDGTLLCWLTDPDRWPAVTSGGRHTAWQLHEQTMTEYLLGLLLNPPAEVAHAPAFLPDRRRAAAVTPPDVTVVGASQPVGYNPVRRPPQDRSEELLAAIGATPGAYAKRDWELLGRVFGAELPHDYRTFSDAVGPGLFCDIFIFGLDAPSPLGIADVLKATLARRFQAPGADRVLHLHPEPDGLIPWGATTDGAWTFFWDPSNWGVSFANRGFRRVHLPGVSFSDFLLRYAAGDDDTMFVFERRVWTKGPSFQAV